MTRKSSLFDFNDYRLFLKEYVRNLPTKRGELKAWAQHLKVHTTLVSQVMMGRRDFNEEQTLDLCDFLGFSSLEKDYFLELLRHARAGSQNLKKYHQQKLNDLKSKALKISERISGETKLTEKESAIFYSSWIYSAIRLCSSLGKGMTLDEVADRLKVDRSTIVTSVEFLKEHGFIKQNGAYLTIGTQYTHLEKGSPFLIRHHSNWRLKALQRADQLSEQELMYTAPFSISEKDFLAIREQIVVLIQEFLKTAKASTGETIACFNIDLIKL